jgi:hypothetical protein
MTSHQMLEMATAVHKTHLNATFHVLRLSPQNTILSFGNLQLDVSFQGFYVVRFFSVHSVLQVAPEKEIWRCQVWQSRGQQSTACCSHSASTALTCVLRTCAVCWGCDKLLVHSTGINRHCFWSKFHLLPITYSRITGKNDSDVLYESLCIFRSLITIVFSQQ